MTNTRRIVIISIVLVALMAVAGLGYYLIKERKITPKAANGAASLEFSPSSGTYQQSNIFNVDLILDTGSDKISDGDINKIHYDPQQLELQDDDANTAGTQITPGSVFQNFTVNSVDTTSGTIQLAGTADVAGFSGRGVVASMRFKGLVAGQSSVTIDTDTSQILEINSGQNILSNVLNGSYTIESTPQPSPTPTPGGGGGGRRTPTPTPKTPTPAPTPTPTPEPTPTEEVIAPLPTEVARITTPTPTSAPTPAPPSPTPQAAQISMLELPITPDGGVFGAANENPSASNLIIEPRYLWAIYLGVPALATILAVLYFFNKKKKSVQKENPVPGSRLNLEKQI